MKRILLNVAKLLLPILVIGWLLSQLDPEQIRQLRERPKDYLRLGVALTLVFACVTVTFVRWWLLVVALGLPFRLRDAFRLGFLGYLLNFVSVGSVGGDLFKALFIAREQPGRRPEAVVTVLIDRIVGLYALLVVASLAMWSGQAHSTDSAIVRALCQATWLLTGVGAVAIAILLALPLSENGRIQATLGRLPLVGGAALRVTQGLRLYRGRPAAFVLIALLSLLVHGTLSLALWLVATGLYPAAPTLGEHFVIVPMAMVANGVPFTPAGLGALELAMDQLYKLVPASSTAASGLLVALAYRLITFAVAGVGAVFYFTHRAEIAGIRDQGSGIRGQE